MGFDDFCNTSLVLELGLNNYNNAMKRSSPSLTLSLSGAGDESGVSSFSSGRIIKRERDIGGGGEESTAERLTITTSSRLMNGQDQDQEQNQQEEEISVSVGRKKLRLNKEQSSLLEESFKNHSTLNPKQKQALARQLNLRPRQVEVWFQNRRARTKLKQTEVDYEFLKKCCETLTDENRRLAKEIQELKTLKLTHQSFLMQIPSPNLTMCPSCENIGNRGGSGNSGKGPTVAAATVVGDGNMVKGSFSITTTKAQFFNPFTNPSKAC